MTKENHEFDILFKRYQTHAKKNGFYLNPNKKITKHLLATLIEQKKKYGKEYCPCRRITKNKEENEKIICPCIYHKEEIEKQGHCHCFLFIKELLKHE